MRDQWDSLLLLLECRSTDELRVQTARQVRRLGFESWIYTMGTPSHPSPDRLNAYPPAWIAHYLQQGYVDIDPVVEHCRNHITPCLWASDPFARRAGYLTDFFSEAADYGLRAGIGIPIHGPCGQSGMISVATDNTAHASTSLRNLGELQLLASFVHEAEQRVVNAAAQKRVRLTARELGCLRWAAEGKTSWEIGQKLSIGERTVVFHLQNSARKLGVFGRRQAIARAMSLQLISL